MVSLTFGSSPICGARPRIINDAPLAPDYVSAWATKRFASVRLGSGRVFHQHELEGFANAHSEGSPARAVDLDWRRLRKPLADAGHVATDPADRSHHDSHRQSARAV